jgi:hypothetical protein
MRAEGVRSSDGNATRKPSHRELDFLSVEVL